MTPDMAFTLVRRAPQGSGAQACDLSEIRRTDALLDLLASRRLRRPSLLHDPAVLLLGTLAEDVDAQAPSPAALAPAPWVAARRAAAATPERGRPAADWIRAAAATAALATMAGAATTAGVMVTGLLLRFARNAAGPSGATWRTGAGRQGPRPR